MSERINIKIILIALTVSIFCGYASAKENADEKSVTFVELGSRKCIPCKMMQPVMGSIEKDYAGKVKVIFYDVWTDEGKPYGKQYGIQAIPTQVFLDKDGNEFFRHTGFLAENKIVELLGEHGVTKE